MLPPFPDCIDTLDTFPIPEGKHFEFKQSIRSIDKLLSTICAFLNAEGGYLIFGIIDNNRKICGLKITSKQVDDFILAHIDAIFQYKRIVYQDTKEGINPEYIKTDIIRRYDDTYIIIIKVLPPDSGISFQTYEGDSFYRLNASNMRIRSDKVYLEEQVNNMLISQKKSIEKEYTNLIKSFKLELKKQSKMLSQLNESNAKLQNIVYEKIIAEKDETEKELNQNKRFTLSRIFDCLK